MVGAFGEVQVMDWGLAKVLAAPERERPAPVVEQPAVSEIRSLRESDGTFTQAGSVLGTPAFMPPEQAAGELDKIDCRSDVFGLGAILCVLLTGNPPYSGRDAQEMRVKAVRGDTQEAFARLDKSGAETDIIALCKHCLAFAPSDRPSDANAIASRLAELFAATTERTQQAERERHTLEVRATEQARRRRAMMWSAAAVIAVLSAGVVASLLQAKRARDAESATTAQLAKTQEAEAAARAKSEELDATLRLISFANVREGQEAKAVEFYQRLLAIRLSAAGEAPSLESQVDIANAYNDLGNAHWRLSQLREVRDSFGKELEVRKSIVAARPETNEYEERLATTYGNLANVLWELEDKDAAIEHRKRTVEVYEGLLKAKPNERWCLSGRAHARLRLGEWLRLAGKFKESREVLVAALSDWLLLRKQDPALVMDYVAATHKEIGLVARESGDLKGEQEAYQLALSDIEHMEQFADKRAEYYELFASVSLELKDSASAVRGYREAVAIRQILLQANPKDADARAALVKAFSHLGGAAYLARDYKLAVDCYEQSLETAKSLDRLKDRSIDVEFLQIVLTNSRAQLDRVAPPPRMKPEK
jgi:tetratricopeptide (TPR) repeat protein